MMLYHRPVALTNALLIDGTGASAVEDATILITGNEVTAAGAAVTIPEHAEVIDLRDKTVLPGLIDAHVHLGGLGFRSTPPFGGRAATDDYAEALAGAL
jgi:imidazolonepropionase-like amidohydrolase